MTINPRIFEKTIQKASKETQFGTTFFEIYDKSTTEICDRLILVQPFGWLIWSKNGKVYVLGDTNHDCPLNYTPAAFIPNIVGEGDHYYNFNGVCLHIVLNDVVNNYRNNIMPAIIPFDIPKLQARPSQFTIIDALNYLFTKWLTMDAPESSNIVVHSHMDSIILNKPLNLHSFPYSVLIEEKEMSIKQKIHLEEVLRRRNQQKKLFANNR